MIAVYTQVGLALAKAVAYASRGRAKIKVVKYCNPYGPTFLYGVWLEKENKYPHRVLYRIRSKERA
jgi:hypothetical protein